MGIPSPYFSVQKKKCQFMMENDKFNMLFGKVNKLNWSYENVSVFLTH
jgi:hypothetical protein